jgi:hypothetical protein
MKNKFLSILPVLAILVLTGPASADQRYYVWTYQYQTMERGTAEFESYTTFSTYDLEDQSENTASEHQFELEVGMTDRFDFSIYQVFGSDPGEALKYKGFKLRSRYRFGEKGSYFMDPLLYLEYKGEPELTEHAFEAKLILARDWGPLNLALNPVLEVEKEDEWEFKPEYAAAISYAFSPLLRAGLEMKGSEEASYLGPVISHGIGDLWMALGSGWKLESDTESKPDFQLRLLLGVGVR